MAVPAVLVTRLLPVTVRFPVPVVEATMPRTPNTVPARSTTTFDASAAPMI
jgi:hypothetical protein